ncbi:hypothetical protein FACS189415_2570 [Bacteroidia bacterium]|nr:hypothetical protein FACS189426_04760 [Bacteroidia bacterium]GHU82323.1 hypothetical protein FACS189415_2570 [Bacteroidia bacterium]
MPSRLTLYYDRRVLFRQLLLFIKKLYYEEHKNISVFSDVIGVFIFFGGICAKKPVAQYDKRSLGKSYQRNRIEK